MSETPETVPLDVSRVTKGSRLKLKDGRTVFVSGMYLGGDGPVFMTKDSPTQTVAQNTPLSQVESVI